MKLGPGKEKEKEREKERKREILFMHIFSAFYVNTQELPSITECILCSFII
jgi:hypothetical protein